MYIHLSKKYDDIPAGGGHIMSLTAFLEKNHLKTKGML